MREIVTAVEMKELDHNTIQKAGISSPVLMERAALKTVEEIVQRLKNKEKEKILVGCGTGNNGGDGLAIARLLQLRGVRTWYYIAGKEEKMPAETAGQLKTAEYYHFHGCKGKSNRFWYRKSCFFKYYQFQCDGFCTLQFSGTGPRRLQ